MRIAILGTRGIPNLYGGFEEFAQNLSVGLKEKGHEVYVYNSSEHEYKCSSYNNVKIINKYCPESKIGSSAHFIYDFLSCLDASIRQFDIIYNLGYQSAAPGIFIFRILKSKSIWITNMDGLEWKRQKWSKSIKWLTKKMEALAVNSSSHLVSDNLGIQEYFKKEYNKNSSFIAYGANIYSNFKTEFLDSYNLNKDNYYLIVSRLEPENNISTILDGFVKSNSKFDFIVIGNHNSKYGEYLKLRYSEKKQIRFIGGVYEKERLNSIRKYSKLYFHGHTVGGTNPSLIEAMALRCKIISHKNQFNKSVLKDFGNYFETSDDISKLILKDLNDSLEFNTQKAVEEIKENYNWEKIVNQHIDLFEKLMSFK